MGEPVADARSASDDAVVLTAPRSSALRVGIWLLHLSLPLLGLWLLIARPELDVIWENHAYHFWLVAAVAAINFGLGLRISRAARERTDARLFLVSLAFMASAGFLLLHALATPGVLLEGKNSGFVVATPVGLLLAAVLVAASAIDFTPERSAALMRRALPLRIGLLVLLLGWGVVSLENIPPLNHPLPVEEARGWLFGLTIAGVPLYLFATVRYAQIYRRRPAVMLIGVITAFALLAESMIAITVARNWQTSWWEWHVLMAAAFGFVAYSAQVEYAREGGSTALFRSISLEETIRRIREEYGAALEALVTAMQRQHRTGDEEPIEPVAARVAQRFGLSPGQGEVLGRAAEALAHEREQIGRLGSLVAVGRETRVIVDEPTLLRRALQFAREGFARDTLRIGLLDEGELRFPSELGSGGPDAGQPDAAARALKGLEAVEVNVNGNHVLALPLTVKGQPAGVLEVTRSPGPFAERDRSVLESLASQLSIALENARLYRQLDTLFRSYMSPEVATALLADPSRAALGGAIREVTVLFADLRGFTTFSERTSPDRVVEMLNRYFGLAVPLILAEGGTVVQFVGDAIMAIWGAPAPQSDHALRAARAGLAMQRAIAEAAQGRPEWPRFRVGINTGPALIGNIGAEQMRNFTAIGDTTNLAARLETSAEEGTIVIGGTTYALIGDVAEVEPMPPLQVKGKAEPVEAYVLTGLRE
jgi:class 3 adenylate cyclase